MMHSSAAGRRGKYRISKNSFHIDFGVLLFSLYNLFYVFYMNGMVGRSLNLVVMVILIAYFGIKVGVKTKGKLKLNQMYFGKEFIWIGKSLLVILVISLLEQLVYMNIKLEYTSFYLYIVIPWLFAFLWANSVKPEHRMIYLYIMFSRFVLSFVMNNLGSISVNSIMAISFSNSMSSMFESSDAHCFFILMILFLICEKRVLAIISGILCMLCFKRLCFILTPVLFFGYRFLADKTAGKHLLIASKIVFIVSPVIIILIVNNAEQISSILGFELDFFASGRISLVRYVLTRMDRYDGFGAISAFMAKNPWGAYARIQQMHCDMLQIYLETTIIGLAAYVNSLFNLVRKNLIVYFLVLYFALEMFTSHFIDFLAAWVLLYMVIIVLNYTNTEERADTLKA